jgi:beta-glucosidase
VCHRQTRRTRGACHLERRPRAAAHVYKALIGNWDKLLATQSVCLVLPIFLPSQQDEPVVRAQEEYARGLLSIDRIAEGPVAERRASRKKATPDVPA